MNENDYTMTEKYLYIDKENGTVHWEKTDKPCDDNVVKYVRYDVVNELKNKLSNAQKEVDNLSMRIYTKY